MAETTEKKYKRRNIDRDDAAYSAELQDAQTQTTLILGQGALARYARECAKFPPNKLSFDDAELHTLWSTLEPDTTLLIAGLRNGQAAEQALNVLISQAAFAPGTARYLYDHDELFEVENFTEALENRTIDVDIFATMLAVHVRLMEASRGKLEAQIPVWKEEFLKSVREAVASGFLSQRIGVDEIEKRTAEVHVIGKDPFLEGDHLVGGSHGTFLIKIDLYNKLPQQRATFFHEAGHGIIAGRNLIVHKHNDQPEESVGYRKNGIRISSYRSADRQWTESLGWLDEAMTDEIAEHLSGQEAVAYPKERLLMQQLITDGVPWNVLIDAYQENYQGDTKAAARLPMMKEFYARLYACRDKQWVRDRDAEFTADYNR